jgi:hypothetical protein
MITNLMLTSGSDAGTDLLADLNRLLREGLAAVDWTEDDPAPRFHVTARGRAELAVCPTIDDGAARQPFPIDRRVLGPVRADAGVTDVPAAGAPSTAGGG